MSKTFRQLRDGDEVYVIKGSNVEITKVSSTATLTKQCGRCKTSVQKPCTITKKQTVH